MMSIPAVQLAGVFTVAIGGTVLLTPLVVRFACSRRLFDLPDDRRVHTVPTPRLGGIAVFCALLAAAVLALGAEPLRAVFTGGRIAFFLSVLGGASIMFATGLADDILGLRPRTKLLVQIVAALMVVSAGWIPVAVRIVPGFDIGVGAVVGSLLMVAWIVAATNAMNLIDGMDGLAGSVALVGFSAVVAAAAVFGRSGTLVLGVACIGATAGFLVFNWSPARIFLGDSGSLILGFLLATLSLRGATSHSGVLHILLPLAVFAVPLIDMSFAISRRWLRGTPVFGADRRHLHHQLLARHLSPARAALYMAAVTAVSIAGGFAASFAPERFAAQVFIAGLLALVTFLFGIVRALRYYEFDTAVSMVSAGPGRLRRGMQDVLRAQDVITELTRAHDIAEANVLLRRRAQDFGFDAMAIRRPYEIGAARGNVVVVLPLDSAGSHVLLIAAPALPGTSARAERVGSCIANALRERVEQHTVTPVGTDVIPLRPRVMGPGHPHPERTGAGA